MPATDVSTLCAHALATARPPSADDPATREVIRQGFTLLGLVAIVGVLLVFGAALLFVLAKNRRSQHDLDRRLTRPSGRSDAWAAAGARAEPIHPDPDLPADDDLAYPPRDGFDEDGSGEDGPFGPDRDDDTDYPPRR
ncbi:MAG: hypothetical protein ACF8Q5_14905 [Phycisphaerales bacterium JB040]